MPSSSVTATNNINLIMSHTPLLSDCGSMGLTLNLTLDGVSTHDRVTMLGEDEANIKKKAETRFVVLLFTNLYLAIFILPVALDYFDGLGHLPQGKGSIWHCLG